MNNLKNTQYRVNNISDFMETELVDFASYSTLRAIASVVDGLKNASRKVVHTVQKNNITSKYKVQNLASLVSMQTEYLHGGVSLEGVIVGLGKNYTGSNNLNLLYPSGNFGNRFGPEASASRYIFTYKEKIFDKMFNKEDNNILLAQEFEGTEIEPRFFVPSLPLILINGSEGIATGFAQKILPRNPEVIKDWITKYIKGEETPELTPWYKDFKGEIVKAEDNQWLLKGSIEKISLTKFVITELPVGYNLKSYTKILDDLEDKKIIKSYKDKSNSKKSIFNFEVSVDSKFLKLDETSILNKLKLIKKVSENFTVIDENNRIVVYNSPEEVIKHYIKVKLIFLQKRKEYLIGKTEGIISELACKYYFIKAVVEGEIKINNQKKVSIIEQLKAFPKILEINGSYEYLLRLPIYNLTSEKIDELLALVAAKKEELEKIKNQDVKEIWLEEVTTIC